MDAEKKTTAQVANRARKLRLFITVAGFAIFVVCAAIAVWLLLHRPIPLR
jgi:cytosine/uracil/thiamine/allantoin permease